MPRHIATVVLLTSLLTTSVRADAPELPTPTAPRTCEQRLNDLLCASVWDDLVERVDTPALPTPVPRTCEQRPVREVATMWAKLFRVPKIWLISLAWTESRFCPHAANISGATGVVQVKLARAVDLVRWVRRTVWGTHPAVLEALAAWHGKREDLRDLRLNVMLAAFDLHRLADKFHRDHDLVMAAYNQGEGVVGRLLAQGRPMSARAVEFVARVRLARAMIQRGEV